jgi:hypothetical protein
VTSWIARVRSIRRHRSAFCTAIFLPKCSQTKSFSRQRGSAESSERIKYRFQATNGSQQRQAIEVAIVGVFGFDHRLASEGFECEAPDAIMQAKASGLANQ